MSNLPTKRKLTEKQVRKEYKEHRKDKTFAECWPDTNRALYGLDVFVSNTFAQSFSIAYVKSLPFFVSAQLAVKTPGAPFKQSTSRPLSSDKAG